MLITSETNVIAADFPAVSERAATRSDTGPRANADLRVMLLTNDLAGCEEVSQAVRAACGHVEQVGSVGDAISRAFNRQFDFILVDLPADQWGEEAIRAIRAAGVKLPLLLVSPPVVSHQVISRHPARVVKFCDPATMDVRKADAGSNPSATGTVVSLFGRTHSRTGRPLANACVAPPARASFVASCSGTFAD